MMEDISITRPRSLNSGVHRREDWLETQWIKQMASPSWRGQQIVNLREREELVELQDPPSLEQSEYQVQYASYVDVARG
jgi:hypothetical protein